MLVLTRKAGEEILIDGRIRVQILATGRSRVRIGVDAPSEVSVIRGRSDRQEADAPNGSVGRPKFVARPGGKAEARLVIN